VSLLLDLFSGGRRAEGHSLWEHGWSPVGVGGMDLTSDSARTAAGVDVNQEKALALVAYFAALRNMSQDIAKLPMQLRRRRRGRDGKAARGSDLAWDHDVSELLREPHSMGGFQFRQLMQFRALGWGNGYAEIVRDATGRAVELSPVHPSRMEPVLDDHGRIVKYAWREKAGDEPIKIPARNVLHVRGIGSGAKGLSLLRVGAEVLGLGLAAQRNAARFFSEGMAKRVVVFSKSILNAPGRKALRERILADKHLDPTGRRLLPIIEGDFNIGDMGIPPEDAQLLESREFTTEEIARLVRMALAKIQYHKRAQGWNSLELLNTDYATDSLQPWCVTWEDESRLKLLEPEERSDYFFKLVLQALMRGDSAARTNYYDSGLRNGWLSPNDVRELEDMNPIDNPAADEYRVQAQMKPIDEPAPKALPPPFVPTPPKPAPADDDDDDDADEEERAAARAALAPLLLDAAERVATKEAHVLQWGLRKHAANAAAFSAWAADLYAKLRDMAGKAFAPALACATHLRGLPPDRVARVSARIAAWLDRDGGMDWAPYCRNVAASTPEARARALADLVLEAVLEEPAHA
jgi:HK97 family phage portal protein